mmetsp:Transcript_16422/g.33820  ORF Transcript_16422/g.33820 Transcript_16422/m.33820 type:complete len:108 (-) Transcript_16422:767-1090(-)
MAHKKQRGRFLTIKYPAVTSTENNTAAKGVPKVDPTPAAAAHAKISSLLASFLARWEKHFCLMRVSAIATAIWTKGPSFPTLRPAVIASTSPTAFVKIVKGVTNALL